MNDKTLVKDWVQLSKVKSSQDYHLEIKPEDGNGWIVDSRTGDHVEYLSTHTFYGSQHEFSTRQLSKYGFDVEVDNWDK